MGLEDGDELEGEGLGFTVFGLEGAGFAPGVPPGVEGLSELGVRPRGEVGEGSGEAPLVGISLGVATDMTEVGVTPKVAMFEVGTVEETGD